MEYASRQATLPSIPLSFGILLITGETGYKISPYGTIVGTGIAAFADRHLSFSFSYLGSPPEISLGDILRIQDGIDDKYSGRIGNFPGLP